MKTARFFALAVLLAVTGCAHAPKMTPLEISGTTIHAAKLAFVGTSAGMRTANEKHLLTATQVTSWNTFAAKFDTLFEIAGNAWLAAAEKGVDTPQSQAALAALQSMLADLLLFQALVATTPPPPAATPETTP